MREKTRSEFGQRLFDERQKAGKSQEQLAKAAGIAQSTLTEAENKGQGSAAVTKLARALGVDAHWLATGEGLRKPVASPFTQELQERLSQLPAEEARRLENTIRGNLDMPTLTVDAHRKHGT